MEIKYKAKSVLRNEWIYGNIVVKKDEKFYLINYDVSDISPYTEIKENTERFFVGEFEKFDLKTKRIEKVELYEFDIIEVYDGDYYGEFIIYFNPTALAFYGLNTDKNSCLQISLIDLIRSKKFEIVEEK